METVLTQCAQRTFMRSTLTTEDESPQRSHKPCKYNRDSSVFFILNQDFMLTPLSQEVLIVEHGLSPLV